VPRCCAGRLELTAKLKEIRAKAARAFFMGKLLAMYQQG
jgi:hypothetical protein